MSGWWGDVDNMHVPFFSGSYWRTECMHSLHRFDEIIVASVNAQNQTYLIWFGAVPTFPEQHLEKKEEKKLLTLQHNHSRFWYPNKNKSEKVQDSWKQGIGPQADWNFQSLSPALVRLRAVKDMDTKNKTNHIQPQCFRKRSVNILNVSFQYNFWFAGTLGANIHSGCWVASAPPFKFFFFF